MRRLGYPAISELMLPAVRESTLATGLLRFVLFKALNISQRNCSLVDSRLSHEANANSFQRAQSALTIPGPRSMPVDAFPGRQQFGIENAAGLYHWLRFWPPETAYGAAPGNRAGT